MLAHLIGPAIRSHWAIENSLHWVMDMLFRDDECRVRTNHAPADFTPIKHMAHKPATQGIGEDFLEEQAQGRRMGPRLPGKPRHGVKTSSDSPGNLVETNPFGQRRVRLLLSD
jgi:hypothetical protein